MKDSHKKPAIKIGRKKTPFKVLVSKKSFRLSDYTNTVTMLNSGASLKLLAFLALNLASMRVVDALAPLGRIYRADGSFIDAKAHALPIAGYNTISRKRQVDSVGAWALLTGTCPEGTVECKTKDTEQKPCCPSSSKCYTDLAQINCCPTGKPYAIES